MLFFLLSFSIVCMAQDDAMKKKVDSLSYISRAKADLVLNHFDSLITGKILYTISDEQYYVILKDKEYYKEFYIQTDRAGNIIRERPANTSKQSRKLLAQAFNVNNYHESFITKIDNPTAAEGNPSYFVFKDAEGKRHGEFSLSVITVPIPIDKQLYRYLLTRLLKESTEKNRADQKVR